MAKDLFVDIKRNMSLNILKLRVISNEFHGFLTG